MIDSRQIFAVALQIAKKFHPARIVLFGYHACGPPDANSDVDLLVIMPDCDDLRAKATEIRAAVDSPFSIDLLVRTSLQVQERLKEVDFFIQEIMEKGNT